MKLQERGHTIFAALRPENEWQKKLAFLADEKLAFFPLKNSIDFSTAKKLAAFAAEKKIKILHAHLVEDYPVAALASHLSSIPLVLTKHSLSRLSRFQLLTVRQAAKIIAASNGAAESVLINNFVSPEKVSVIYNGVDFDVFCNAAKDEIKCREMRQKLAPDTALLAASVGELSAHKGHEDFICAAAIVARKFPDAKFLIVGGSSAKSRNYRTHLLNLAARLNLTNQIIFTGWQSEMPTIYGAIDVLVSAMREETFSPVIAEAMASGTAVVAAKTAGAGEILENKVTGILTPIQNPPTLAAAISELFENTRRRENLGTAAQLKVQEKFSLDKMTAKTEQIYRDIIMK